MKTRILFLTNKLLWILCAVIFIIYSITIGWVLWIFIGDIVFLPLESTIGKKISLWVDYIDDLESKI